MEEVYYDKHAVQYIDMNKLLLQILSEKLKFTNGVCLVCFQNRPLCSNFFCPHSYCSDCWKDYIRSNLLQNSIYFRCMDTGCKEGVVTLEFAKKVAPGLVDLYRKKICMNYSIGNKTVSYCPSENCLYFCEKPTICQQNYVECLCGTKYCFKCEKEPH